VPLNFNAYIPEVSTKTVSLISATILTLAVAIIFIIGLIKKYYILSLSIFITLITLGPSLLLSIMSISATPVAERYLFVPTIGYSLFIGYVFLLLYKKIGLNYSAIPLIIVLAIFLHLNIDRQAVWKDRLSLWKDTSEKSVYAFPHSNYALALQNAGDDEKALKAYAQALNPEIIDTDHGRAITANNLGLLFIRLEQYQKAEMILQQALQLSPGYSRTFYNLGLINYIKGEVTNSKKAYETALGYVNKASESNKRNPKLKLLKARILINLGNTTQAIKEIDSAVKMGLEGELLEEAKAIRRIYKNSCDDQPSNDTDQ